MNNYRMNPELPSTHPPGHLDPFLVDAFAEFWHADEAPKHDVIDRKIAAAGLPVPPDGSKERKIVGTFLAANDDQAYLLMRGLLDTLRKFSKWDARYISISMGMTSTSICCSPTSNNSGMPDTTDGNPEGPA